MELELTKNFERIQRMTNEENKLLNKAISDYQREMYDKGGFYQSEMAQYLMQLSFEKCAQWKDEQYLDNVEGDAKSYVDGVAKANPDLSEWVLNFIETAYIAGRNRIK